VIVLDTHAWIWLVSAPQLLSRPAQAAIDSAEVIGVSAMSAFEIATKAVRGYLDLDRPIRTWIDHASTRDRIELLVVTPRICVTAALLADVGFHGDPADRLIAASAIESRAPLVTKDGLIRRWSERTGRVSTVW
jgi:PIN domain nuclease of toxin-antitoxin system